MSDSTDPEKLVLHAGKLKGLGFLVLSVVFCAGGVWMIQIGKPVGWLPAVIFGIGIPVFGINLLPSASKLTLTPQGFAITIFFRARPVTPWTHVVNFIPTVVGHNSTVGWDYVAEHRPPGRAAGWSKSLNGCEAALPDTYGMKIQDLVSLMEDWRQRYGTAVHKA